MKLLTFGGLSVEGTTYGREKPLVLLAYLCLEGQKTRDQLARLFWPEAANSMNSLAQHLIRLRPLGDVIRENDKWVEATCECDALVFRDHHRAGRTLEAAQSYTGAFLEGISSQGIGTELELWIEELRDTLGAEARSAHLTLAEHHHARQEFEQAARHAETAYRLPGAGSCEAEDIPRIYRLLGRRDHPLTVQLRREAQDYGLDLPTTPEPPPASVNIIGRQHELGQLQALAPNQVVWISGPPGIGKTALLSALAAGGGWRVLPARNGLPLGTLEPISPHPLTSTADALNALRDTRLRLAIDGWEDTDDTTRTALTLAARQHPGATIVIAARQPPALPVDHHLPLHALSEQELQDHPGAHEATGGHPTLLAAYLRGTPANQTLEAHLNHLGTDARRLFLALAAQEQVHLNATRAALNLSAATLAGTLDQLTREGLTTPEGQVRAGTPARDLLEAHPQDTKLLHLHLARAHPKETAWPHWLRSQDLWEAEDEAACAAAAHWYADQEMKRGYPAKAAKTLEVAPQTDEVKLLRGWALVKGGFALEAESWLDTLDVGVTNIHALSAVRGMCKFRLGKLEQCKLLCHNIPLNLGIWSGHAAYILGSVYMRLGKIKDGLKHYRRSEIIFRGIGENILAYQSEIMLATLEVKFRGANPYSLFPSLLAHLESCPSVKAPALVNFADSVCDFTSGRNFNEAESIYLEAVKDYQEIGNKEGEANALNSWGASAHLVGETEKAKKLYTLAAEAVSGTGNLRLIGLISANIAELDNNQEIFQNVVDFLSDSGHNNLASSVKYNLNQRLK